MTGFEIPEIDLILQDAANAADPEDELPIEETGPAVAQPGDLWQLGKHRVLCGNSLQENSYKTLMRGKRAAIVFSVTRRITYASTAMCAATVPSSTVNFRWRLAK